MNFCWWVRGDEFRRMADVSIASVKRQHPHANCVVIEDDGTRPQMVANLDAQIQMLSRLQTGEKVLFLDADIILRKPFVFPDSDLCVTWRDKESAAGGDYESMPYNYGVVGATVNIRTLEAFFWLRARILKMSAQYQGWYGNQMALASLLGCPANTDHRIRWSTMEAGTPLSVTLLPCATHNFTPDTEDEDVRDKTVIHLKGERKAWMQRYAA